MARWDHVDFKTREWFIPRENVKSTRGKKQDHHVFLSDFALVQFKRLYEESGHAEWCFPSKDEKSHVDVKSVSKRIGDRQVKFKDRTKESTNHRHMIYGAQGSPWCKSLVSILISLCDAKTMF